MDTLTVQKWPVFIQCAVVKWTFMCEIQQSWPLRTMGRSKFRVGSRTCFISSKMRNLSSLRTVDSFVEICSRVKPWKYVNSIPGRVATLRPRVSGRSKELPSSVTSAYWKSNISRPGLLIFFRNLSETGDEVDGTN